MSFGFTRHNLSECAINLLLFFGFVFLIEKGDELFYSSKTYLQTTEKITLYFSKHSEPKDEININYLLVGVGGAISLFLFILIMQLCKKHTSTKRKSTNLRMDNGNHTTDESTNQTQNCNRKDSYQIPNVNKSLPFYDHMNSEYQEIDECLERKNAFAFFNGQGRFEKKHPLSCPSSSCASGNEDQRFPLKTSNSTQFTINTCLDVVHSDAYLQPMFVSEKQHSKDTDEVHLYIDVSG